MEWRSFASYWSPKEFHAELSMILMEFTATSRIFDLRKFEVFPTGIHEFQVAGCTVHYSYQPQSYFD